MAALAAWDLSTSYSVFTLYTYGEPRVGNAAFAAALAGKIYAWRVTHSADIVSERRQCLPPRPCSS